MDYWGVTGPSCAAWSSASTPPGGSKSARLQDTLIKSANSEAKGGALARNDEAVYVAAPHNQE